MARIRTMKPELWGHAQLGKLSPMARLTFLGLIQFADDTGRGRGDSDWLWGQLHGNALTTTKRWWNDALTELRRVRDDKGPLVIFYKVAGATYYWLPGFSRQQYIEKPSKSKFPDPPNSGNGRGAFGPGTRIKDQGEDQGREGGVAPPTPPPVAGGSPPVLPDTLRVLDAALTTAGAVHGKPSTAKPMEPKDETVRRIAKRAEKLHLRNTESTVNRWIAAHVYGGRSRKLEELFFSDECQGMSTLEIDNRYFGSKDIEIREERDRNGPPKL